jgi:peroxiredoxin Q/BCP
MLSKFDVVVFGASTDALDKNKKFAEKLDLKYPLLSDSDQKVAKAYGILRGTRSKRIAFVIGKDGKIAHIVKKVNLKQHGSQLVKLLEKLKVEKKPKGVELPTVEGAKLESETNE